MHFLTWCAGSSQDQLTSTFVYQQFQAAGIPVIELEQFTVMLTYPQVICRVITVLLQLMPWLRCVSFALFLVILVFKHVQHQ